MAVFSLNAWHPGLFSGLQMSCQRVSSSKCGDLSGIAKSQARNWASPKILDHSYSWVHSSLPVRTDI